MKNKIISFSFCVFFLVSVRISSYYSNFNRCWMIYDKQIKCFYNKDIGIYETCAFVNCSKSKGSFTYSKIQFNTKNCKVYIYLPKENKDNNYIYIFDINTEKLNNTEYKKEILKEIDTIIKSYKNEVIDKNKEFNPRDTCNLKLKFLNYNDCETDSDYQNIDPIFYGINYGFKHKYGNISTEGCKSLEERFNDNNHKSLIFFKKLNFNINNENKIINKDDTKLAKENKKNQNIFLEILNNNINNDSYTTNIQQNNIDNDNLLKIIYYNPINSDTTNMQNEKIEDKNNDLNIIEEEKNKTNLKSFSFDNNKNYSDINFLKTAFNNNINRNLFLFDY